MDDYNHTPELVSGKEKLTAFSRIKQLLNQRLVLPLDRKIQQWVPLPDPIFGPSLQPICRNDGPEAKQHQGLTTLQSSENSNQQETPSINWNEASRPYVRPTSLKLIKTEFKSDGAIKGIWLQFLHIRPNATLGIVIYPGCILICPVELPIDNSEPFEYLIPDTEALDSKNRVYLPIEKHWVEHARLRDPVKAAARFGHIVLRTNEADYDATPKPNHEKPTQE
jgi:hypothetical protein